MEAYLQLGAEGGDTEFVAHELAPTPHGSNTNGPRQRVNQRVAAALGCQHAATIAATAQEGKRGHNPGLTALKNWSGGRRVVYHPATRSQVVRASRTRDQLAELVNFHGDATIPVAATDQLVRAVNHCEGLELGALGYTATREKLYDIAAKNNHQMAARDCLAAGHDRIAAVDLVLATVGIDVSGIERAEFVLRSPQHMLLDVRLSQIPRNLQQVVRPPPTPLPPRLCRPATTHPNPIVELRGGV